MYASILLFPLDTRAEVHFSRMPPNAISSGRRDWVLRASIPSPYGSNISVDLFTVFFPLSKNVMPVCHDRNVSSHV